MAKITPVIVGTEYKIKKINMKILQPFLLITVCACTFQNLETLNCKIPNGIISFKDSSEVFLDNVSVGLLMVDKMDKKEFTAHINFKERINLPDNSVLIFQYGLVGESYFKIIKGSSKNYFMNNSKIIFLP